MAWSDWNRRFTFPGESDLLAVYKTTTMLTNLEAKFLAYLATKAPSSGCVVEIGSRSGKSTSYLATVAKNLEREPVYAIDLWEDASKKWTNCGSFEQFTTKLERLNLLDMVRPIKGDSRQIGAQWQEPVSLLFIDGDHSYEGALADYKNWSPHVIPGGILAFHDSMQPSFPDVRRVIEEVVIPSGLWSDPFEIDSRAGIWCSLRKDS